MYKKIVKFRKINIQQKYCFTVLVCDQRVVVSEPLVIPNYFCFFKILTLYSPEYKIIINIIILKISTYNSSKLTINKTNE